MRSRRTFWILLCLLLAAGAWLLLHRENRTAAVKDSVAQKIAAHRKFLTPNLVATKSGSTAPKILPSLMASANSAQAVAPAKTNKFAYRLTNTTKTIGELTDNRHAVLLENALIDTSARMNFSIPKSLQASADPGAYIVQANGPIGNAFRAMLAAAGAQIVSYIPNDAYLVRISSPGADTVAGSPLTEAVIPYDPYYKVQPSLLGFADEPLPV